VAFQAKRRVEGAERRRLEQAARGEEAWRRFGPYLADRQWGTVREDYSAGGDAWGEMRTTKGPDGESLFTGGFLGLDNIGLFDRSMKLPGGVRLEQSDATAWMAFFCNEMLAITLELAKRDPDYEEMATTFAQHFAFISQALNGAGGLWDDEAGFYHDQLRAGDRRVQLKVRSMVGLLPFVGVTLLRAERGLEGVTERLRELADSDPATFRRQVEGPREVPGPDGQLVRTLLVSLVPRAARAAAPRHVRRGGVPLALLAPVGVAGASKAADRRRAGRAAV
jgi:hypothetical protein